MSYIDNTRRSLTSAYETTVCITKDECNVLLPFIQKAYKGIKSKYDKYDDIRNGGEATERDVNLLMKYSERLDHLDSLLYNMNEIVDKSKKE